MNANTGHSPAGFLPTGRQNQPQALQFTPYDERFEALIGAIFRMAADRHHRASSAVAQLARCLLALLAAALPLRAADWPTYQHDARRSGASDETLEVSRLRLAWTWRSPQPPQPAWSGPARWDAYAGLRDLPSMRNYDLAFHAIAVGNAVYFGSSADDTVRCLDAETGREIWSFTTDAPVRLAPTWSAEKIYFGSDDGFVYCLRAVDGQLLWKFQPAPPRPKVLHNGRFISLAPCRTGVLVADDTAYFAHALLPWEPSYLSAVDAETGRAEGPGRYVRQLDGMTLEGTPAATSDLLVYPQGRVAPQLFRRADGQDQGQVKKSSGGSIVVVSLDAGIFHGPGADSRRGDIRRSDPRSLEMIASHGRGNALVCAGNQTYMLTDDALVASDLVQGSVRWSVPSDFPHALIASGNVLVAGGRDEVGGFAAEDGKLLWRHPVQGNAFGLAVARGRLWVSTDEGVIHAFCAATALQPEASEPMGSPTTTPDAPTGDAQPDGTLAEIPVLDLPHLIGRWVFQTPAVRGEKVLDLAGTAPGRLLAPVRLERSGAYQSLVCDGAAQSVRVADDLRRAPLPTAALTAEAWVRIDQPLAWGGIVGALQDNGNDEHGWLLGYRDDRFSFALAGTRGNGRLTYLTADAPFQTGQWHHVAGTYDGTVLKIYVDGRLAGTTLQQQGDIRYPPRGFFEIGAYHDDNEYHRLSGRIHEVRVYETALTSEQIAAHAAATADRFPAASPAREPLRLAAGPWLQFVAPGEALVRWQTAEPTASELVYGLDEAAWEVADPTPKTDHELRLHGLRHKRLYWYAVRGQRDGQPATTDRFECDTRFNYTPSPACETDVQLDRDDGLFSQAAQDILARTGVRDGICLVYGSGDGRLAWQLARHSRLGVIGVETDLQRVERSRQTLAKTGCYGTRIAIHHVASLADLPLVGCFANLVVSERMLADGQCPGTAAEVRRVLRPDGGVACLGQPAGAPQSLSAERLRAWLADSPLPARLTSDDRGVWASCTCPPLPGAGQWTHLYGDADNSGYGGESLRGVAGSQDMAVQWLGEPGPRFQPDRNGRKPAPLSTAGRLYLQGLQRIVTLDAYNGTVLWSLELPGLERFNMPRDCGNWCADRQYLYAAVRDRCWRIDAASGHVVDLLEVVPATNADWQYDWGYLAVDDRRVIGSAVKRGTAWTDFWGGENAGWYDARSGPVTFKVCSDNLFARDKASGRPLWTYRAGVILNSTITMAGGRIYFVECRNPSVKDAAERRIGSPELWQDQVLVALDAETGSTAWEHPLQTQPGDVVFYLAHSRDRLVVTASTNGQYHVYGLSAERGEPVWEQQFSWPGGKGDHGKAMSRPAIVGDHVYVRPAVMALADGALSPLRIPDGKCGTYACTADALIFRTLTVSMWNRHSGALTDWRRLRPDCWLSTIPAAGMLLSPEGGGGCSCGNWLETSIGFLPVAGQAD